MDNGKWNDDVLRIFNLGCQRKQCWIVCGVLLAWFFAGAGSVPVTQARVWHVCMECPDGDFKTISDAVRKAEPRDTILVYWEPRYPYYMESLVIDKPLRIISHPAAGDLMEYDLYPVITATGDSIIRITVPGVELIGFNIMFLEKPGEPDDPQRFDTQVGIRLDAPALIRQCAITNCSTGILAAYTAMNSDTGSRIQMCRVGLPPDHGLDRRGLRQTRNLFGLVLLGAQAGSGYPRGSGMDRITDSQIMRNLYYGVVYTPENPPQMVNNLVELNGTAPYRLARAESPGGGRLVWVDEADTVPEQPPADALEADLPAVPTSADQPTVTPVRLAPVDPGPVPTSSSSADQ